MQERSSLRSGNHAAAVGPYPGASLSSRGVPGLPSSSSTVATTTAAVSHPTQRRLLMSTLDSFDKRVKPLPPDANVTAAPHVCLYQLEEHVYFACSKCRKDGISSDCVAVDTVHKIIMCTRCAARILRPKQFRPSRVVPFPSLLSWLNHKPAQAMSTVPDEIGLRAAEAVAPTGHRVATEMLGGGPMDLKALPATPMNTGTAISLSGQQQRQGGGINGKHPCLRVWGRCAHGETCLFKQAPEELCIAYLMGLCDGGPSCSLLHQNVYDLPPQDAAGKPSSWRVQDLQDPSSPIMLWMDKCGRSANRAEWQLWHNGSVLQHLLGTFFPPEVEKASDPAEGLEAPIALNIRDISSALDFI